MLYCTSMKCKWLKKILLCRGYCGTDQCHVPLILTRRSNILNLFMLLVQIFFFLFVLCSSYVAFQVISFFSLPNTNIMSFFCHVCNASLTSYQLQPLLALSKTDSIQMDIYKGSKQIPPDRVTHRDPLSTLCAFGLVLQIFF